MHLRNGIGHVIMSLEVHNKAQGRYPIKHVSDFDLV